MIKARRLGPMVGLFVVAFVFALMLTVTMVSNTYACGEGGRCVQYYEVCPFDCDGNPCDVFYPLGGDGPCCGEAMSYVCWIPIP